MDLMDKECALNNYIDIIKAHIEGKTVLTKNKTTNEEWYKLPNNFTDFDFTHEYLDAIAKGLRFIIKDEDSQICKHKAVSYRTITKNIDNLDNYYADLYED